MQPTAAVATCAAFVDHDQHMLQTRSVEARACGGHHERLSIFVAKICSVVPWPVILRQSWVRCGRMAGIMAFCSLATSFTVPQSPDLWKF